MKRIILASVAGAALLAGVSAASAQTFQSDGSYYYGNGPFVERGVGLQIGPVGGRNFLHGFTATIALLAEQ